MLSILKEEDQLRLKVVKLIIKEVIEFNLSHETLYNAVMLSDKYHKDNNLEYSKEIALCCFVIAAKREKSVWITDVSRYNHKKLKEIERNIVNYYQFQVYFLDPLGTIFNIISYYHSEITHYPFDGGPLVFLYRDLVKIPNFQNLSPATILLAVKLLLRKKKLHSYLLYQKKQRIARIRSIVRQNYDDRMCRLLDIMLINI